MANDSTNPNPQAQVEWTTVAEDAGDEEKFSFDIPGDNLIGIYLGHRNQSNDNGNYVQLRVQGTDDVIYFVNANYSLQTAMRSVRPGTLVRITYTGDKDTGQPSPMRLFKVESGRARRAPAATK
jgi:hypothetical protein